MGRIHIPRGASDVMTVLALDGFDSYVVGGCVRDSLLGLEPHDWDICTNATPVEVLETFAKRGVKTIVICSKPIDAKPLLAVHDVPY